MKRFLILAALALCPLSGGFAHEMRPGYLEIRETSPETYDVLWKVPARGINERFGLYLRFSEDVGIVGDPVSAFVEASHVEKMKIKRPGGLTGSTIAIDGLSSTYTDVLLSLERLDGSQVTRRLTPEEPSYVVEARPSWFQTAWTYFGLGIEHILLGVDHLLFVLGLLLIVDGRWRLVKTITAFTIAHSLTLGMATLGYAQVPVEPLNAAIALSILFLGPEIIRVWRGETSFTIRHPWLVAFLFGLLHGFGFASGLSELGVGGSELAFGLFLFNLGVEMGQIGFVLIILGLLDSFQTLEVRWPRWAEFAPGYVVGGLGAYWTIERVTVMWGTL